MIRGRWTHPGGSRSQARPTPHSSRLTGTRELSGSPHRQTATHPLAWRVLNVVDHGQRRPPAVPNGALPPMAAADRRRPSASDGPAQADVMPSWLVLDPQCVNNRHTGRHGARPGDPLRQTRHHLPRGRTLGGNLRMATTFKRHALVLAPGSSSNWLPLWQWCRATTLLPDCLPIVFRGGGRHAAIATFRLEVHDHVQPCR